MKKYAIYVANYTTDDYHAILDLNTMGVNTYESETRARNAVGHYLEQIMEQGNYSVPVKVHMWYSQEDSMFLVNQEVYKVVELGPKSRIWVMPYSG